MLRALTLYVVHLTVGLPDRVASGATGWPRLGAALVALVVARRTRR